MAEAKPGRGPEGRKSAPGATGGTGQQPAETDSTAEPEQAEDDLRRKFREALDRKRAQQADSNAQRGGPGGGKVPGAHGPAHSRRSFRRKSGG
jgi:hypothetical protein